MLPHSSKIHDLGHSGGSYAAQNASAAREDGRSDLSAQSSNAPDEFCIQDIVQPNVCLLAHDAVQQPGGRQHHLSM